MLFKIETKNYRLLLFLIFVFITIISIARTEGTWETVKHIRGSAWRDVFFLDESYGWAVGSYGAVLSTENGGKDWKILRHKPEIFDLPEYDAVYFITEEKGWIVGRGASHNGVIYCSQKMVEKG